MPIVSAGDGGFLPTPSARRATGVPSPTQADAGFLPTPSARRATKWANAALLVTIISTHALREEGDEVGDVGFTLWDISTHALREEGDKVIQVRRKEIKIFLPTPSARRATHEHNRTAQHWRNFYPRPPRGGRRTAPYLHFVYLWISTHALREEGDYLNCAHSTNGQEFLPTPSARRATRAAAHGRLQDGAFLPTPSARRATYRDVITLYHI